MSYHEDFQQYADLCRTDPAFIMVISNALRSTRLGEICGWTSPAVSVEGPPPAFPSVREITAIQTSVFDNWPQGKPVKGIPSRYGIAMEVWTQPAHEIVIQKGRKPNFKFKAQMALMDGPNLKRQLADLRRKQRRSPLDKDYLAELDMMAEAIMGSDLRVGMVNTNIADDKSGYDRGRYYHANQFVMVRMDGSKVESAILRLGPDDADTTRLAPFQQNDAAGNDLARNVVAQSRDARCDMIMTSWATNES